MIIAFEGGPTCSGEAVYKYFLSFRFLKSRMISYLAVAFTGIGVLILVGVLCVMGGFEEEFRSSIRGFHSHLTVESQFFYNVRSADEIIEAARKVEGIVACAPYIETMVMISGITVDFGKLKGIDPGMEAEVSEIDTFLLSEREVVRELILKPQFEDEFDIEGKFGDVLLKISDEKDLSKVFTNKKTDLEGILVGSEIFLRFKLEIHDTLTLTAPSGKDLAKGVKPVEREFEVVGVFRTGNYEVDRRFCYCLLADVQEFIEVGRDRLSGIAMKVEDFEDVDGIQEELALIAARFPDEALQARSWKEKNRSLLQAVRLEKWLITVIIFFVLTLVTALIVAILTMTVVEKTRDIGILRALGASGGGILMIFLSQGILIGGFGAAWGLGAGLLLVANVNWLAARIEGITGYHPFPKDIYYLDQIPARIDLVELGTLIGVVLSISFTLCLFPAWRAVRVNTIKALRYE